jgi:hypothetical protein
VCCLWIGRQFVIPAAVAEGVGPVGQSGRTAHRGGRRPAGCKGRRFRAGLDRPLGQPGQRGPLAALAAPVAPSALLLVLWAYAGIFLDWHRMAAWDSDWAVTEPQWGRRR